MRLPRASIFVVPICALLILLSLMPFQLRTIDVRASMDEMLAYHVEYKEFTPMLAKRSLKIYLEQFDGEKVYLLSNEAKPYLDPSDRQLKSVVQAYQKDDLSEWRALNQVVQGAIMRGRALRAQIAQQLASSKEAPKMVSIEGYADYASSEQELASRIRNIYTRILLAEMRNAPTKEWTAERKQKVFALWEKRFNRVENSYLAIDPKGAKVSPQMLEHYLAMHSLKAMAKCLDAHTSYFSPDEAMEMRTSLEKQFEGIGVVLREGIDGVVIQGLVRGGPAEKSGKIAPGDLIVDINGESMSNATYEDILKKLQGERGGSIQLGLMRSDTGDKTTFHTVVLRRERIIMEDERVRYTFEPYADGIIGKLILPSFYESADGAGCEEDMRQALRALKQKGNLLGLVLDMRDNSGGFLNQAVKVAGLFISSGVIVVSKYSQGEVQYLRDLDGRCYYNGPLVILTSKASASAAEIVAQALQDYGTALVVGDDRTYGKGTIQYQTVTDT
ncbi:MAG: S41 family peptidase, partial [Chlamydiota bacterium]